MKVAIGGVLFELDCRRSAMSKSDSLNQVELLRTNIEGVMLFPPLPGGYDPLTASHDSLRAHGIFFPRPDGKRSPHALAKWMRMVHRVPRSDEEAARQRAHLLEKAGKLEPQIGVTHHWRGKRGASESGSNVIGKLERCVCAATRPGGKFMDSSYRVFSGASCINTVRLRA
jgi:hypothetical protein